MNERPVTGKRGARRVLWIALIIVAVVLVMVILQGIRCSSSEKAEVASGNEVQPSAPRFELQNAPEKPTPAPVVPPQPKEGKSLGSKDAPRSYQEAVRRRQLRRLEERWQGEREGRDWTHRVEQRFLDEFQKREIPGKFKQLDCRQTLCRMQIAFDGQDDAAKINAIEHDADTDWYTDFQLIEGEHVIVTAYLGAPGVNLRDITDDPPAR
jgi:hypothetical protein